jgi:hypothetical protein
MAYRDLLVAEATTNRRHMAKHAVRNFSYLRLTYLDGAIGDLSRVVPETRLRVEARRGHPSAQKSGR